MFIGERAEVECPEPCSASLRWTPVGGNSKLGDITRDHPLVFSASSANINYLTYFYLAYVSLEKVAHR